MATTFVDVLLQLRDELGADVLSGGKIQTDAAGTTTPLVTYQDLAGATPNTNPVILDSSGMAVIRQTNGAAYKWRVYDSDDNLLWTRDNITVGTSSSAAGTDYTVHLSFEGTPTAQGWMGGHIFDREVLFPIDFDGAQGSVETNPAASYVISIKRNGTEIGTATVSTAGAYTFASTSHTTYTLAAADKLTFVGPDVLGTAANFTVTLAGAVQ